MKSAWLLWHWSQNELTIGSGLKSTNIIRSMNNNHNFFEENIRRRHLQQYELYGHGHKQMAVSSAIELTTNLKCLWPNTRAYAMHLRLNWTRAKIRMKIAWRNGALERKPHIITLRSIHFDQSLRLASPSQSFEKEKKNGKSSMIASVVTQKTCSLSFYRRITPGQLFLKQQHYYYSKRVVSNVHNERICVLCVCGGCYRMASMCQ